jgi:hypothetical protein
LGDVGATAVAGGSGLDRDDLVAHVLSLGLKGFYLAPNSTWDQDIILDDLVKPAKNWGTRYRHT